MRPPPTTFESIEAIALRDPQRLALVDGVQRLSYGDLLVQLVRFTIALERLGVRRGQRVAVSRHSFALQLLLLLACENLGAATLSFNGAGDADAPSLFALVDWVLTEAPQQCPAGVRSQRLDAAYIDEVQRIDPNGADGMGLPRAVLAFDEPQRMTRTSGSSGPSRFMLLSRQAQEYWIESGARSAGYTADSRLVIDGPMVINVAFTRSCGCLRRGGAVLSLDAAAFPDHEISHVWALPARLEALLRELPPGYAPRKPVQVGTGGGSLSPQLRQQALQVFGGVVTNRYGTNEVGLICDDMSASGRGYLSPGVDVRIVDTDGKDLPAGESGLIAVRTPAMTQGYVYPPDAPSSAFRDGWFHTGDWGLLAGRRLLQLGGRHDDLLNLGGLKMPASELESRIRCLRQVADCAALAVNLDQGAVTIGIALVLAPEALRSEVVQELQQLLALGVTTEVRVIFAASLPRLEATGKVDRIALQRLFRSPAG